MITLKRVTASIISGACMKEVPNILWLEEIRKEDIISVGGKGASLGEMASIGLPVPKAFVVTAQAFRRFLVETSLEKKLSHRSNGSTWRTTRHWRNLPRTQSHSSRRRRCRRRLRDDIRSVLQEDVSRGAHCGGAVRVQLPKTCPMPALPASRRRSQYQG